MRQKNEISGHMWADQVRNHEKKIRRQAFWAGVGWTITLFAVGYLLFDYAVTTWRL